MFIPLIVSTVFWRLGDSQSCACMRACEMAEASARPLTPRATAVDDRLRVLSFIIAMQGWTTFDIVLLFPVERRAALADAHARAQGCC